MIVFVNDDVYYMRKIIKIFLFIAFLMICNEGKSTTGVGVETINIKGVLNKYLCEDFIESVKIIPLETSDLSLIGQIRKIESNNNKWYISEFNDSPIKVYSKNGNYISSVGKKGQGPGEFIQITDFSVKNDTVNIFGWSGNKKWIRMRTNNTLLYETDMNFPFSECLLMDNGTHLFHVGNGIVSNEMSNYLYCIDQSYRVLDRFFVKESPVDLPYAFYQKHFASGLGDEILYRRDYNDTLFCINQKMDIIPKYKLDFGKAWYSRNFLEDNSNKNFMQIHYEFEKSGYPKFIVFAQSPNHVLVRFTRNENGQDINYVTVYEKTTKETYNFKEEKGTLLSLITNIQGYDGNSFYGFVAVSDLLEFAQCNEAQKPLFKDIIDSSKKLDEMDNPVLVIFNLKRNISGNL